MWTNIYYKKKKMAKSFKTLRSEIYLSIQQLEQSSHIKSARYLAHKSEKKKEHGTLINLITKLFARDLCIVTQNGTGHVVTQTKLS